MSSEACNQACFGHSVAAVHAGLNTLKPGSFIKLITGIHNMHSLRIICLCLLLFIFYINEFSRWHIRERGKPGKKRR